MPCGTTNPGSTIRLPNLGTGCPAARWPLSLARVGLHRRRSGVDRVVVRLIVRDDPAREDNPAA